MNPRQNNFRLLTIHGKLNPQKDESEARLRNDLYLVGSLTLDYGGKGKINIRLVGYEVPLTTGQSRGYCMDLLGYDKEFNPYIIELKTSITSDTIDKVIRQIDLYEKMLTPILPCIESELSGLLMIPSFKLSSVIHKIILIPREFYENKNMKQYKGITTKLCSISRLRSADALLMKRTSKNDVVLRVHNK